MTRVFIPSQLQAYCAGATHVEAAGRTLAAIFHDLDTSYPGLRFRVVDEQGRIRRHMRVFIGSEPAHRLDLILEEGDEVLIFGALSGG